MKKMLPILALLALLWPAGALADNTVDWLLSGTTEKVGAVLDPGTCADFSWTTGANESKFLRTQSLALTIELTPDTAGTNTDGAADLYGCTAKNLNTCRLLQSFSSSSPSLVTAGPRFLYADPTGAYGGSGGVSLVQVCAGGSLSSTGFGATAASVGALPQPERYLDTDGDGDFDWANLWDWDGDCELSDEIRQARNTVYWDDSAQIQNSMIWMVEQLALDDVDRCGGDLDVLASSSHDASTDNIDLRFCPVTVKPTGENEPVCAPNGSSEGKISLLPIETWHRVPLHRFYDDDDVDDRFTRNFVFGFGMLAGNDSLANLSTHTANLDVGFNVHVERFQTPCGGGSAGVFTTDSTCTGTPLPTPGPDFFVSYNDVNYFGTVWCDGCQGRIAPSGKSTPKQPAPAVTSVGRIHDEIASFGAPLEIFFPQTESAFTYLGDFSAGLKDDGSGSSDLSEGYITGLTTNTVIVKEWLRGSVRNTNDHSTGQDASTPLFAARHNCQGFLSTQYDGIQSDIACGVGLKIIKGSLLSDITEEREVYAQPHSIVDLSIMHLDPDGTTAQIFTRPVQSGGRPIVVRGRALVSSDEGGGAEVQPIRLSESRHINIPGFIRSPQIILDVEVTDLATTFDAGENMVAGPPRGQPIYLGPDFRYITPDDPSRAPFSPVVVASGTSNEPYWVSPHPSTGVDVETKSYTISGDTSDPGEAGNSLCVDVVNGGLIQCGVCSGDGTTPCYSTSAHCSSAGGTCTPAADTLVDLDEGEFIRDIWIEAGTNQPTDRECVVGLAHAGEPLRSYEWTVQQYSATEASHGSVQEDQIQGSPIDAGWGAGENANDAPYGFWDTWHVSLGTDSQPKLSGMPDTTSPGSKAYRAISYMHRPVDETAGTGVQIVVTEATAGNVHCPDGSSCTCDGSGANTLDFTVGLSVFDMGVFTDLQ